jgi:hypothetical protein
VIIGPTYYHPARKLTLRQINPVRRAGSPDFRPLQFPDFPVPPMVSARDLTADFVDWFNATVGLPHAAHSRTTQTRVLLGLPMRRKPHTITRPA